jgi:hypothetical protein
MRGPCVEENRMSDGNIDQLIARVDAQGKSPEANRKAGRAALMAP